VRPLAFAKFIRHRFKGNGVMAPLGPLDGGKDMPERRLSDKILSAHKIACAENKEEIAKLLLEALEYDLSSIGGEKQEHRKWSEAMEEAFQLHEQTFGDLKTPH